MNKHKKNVTCKACYKGYAIVGNYATECSECSASIDMNTGEPFRNDGKVVYTGQFGGKD